MTTGPRPAASILDVRARAVEERTRRGVVHAGRCNELGRLRLAGSGVALDLPAAAVRFLKACDGGEPAGCHNLGAMHEEGSGVAKSQERALELYQKACEAGLTSSCRMAPAAPIIAPRR